MNRTIPRVVPNTIRVDGINLKQGGGESQEDEKG